jgi:cholesterol transport system auxiliary component
VRILLLLPLMALTACAGLLGSGPAPDLYTLAPASRFAEGLPRVPWTLLIEEPTAVGGLDANRIAVQRTPNEVRYFADVRWVERTTRMVQGLLVESFERSQAVASVDRYTVGPRVEYVLKSELRDFQAELFNNARIPVVRVRLTARLVRGVRQEPVWVRDFSAQVTARTAAAPEVVAAFDQALGQVMAEIVAVTVRDTPPR